MENAFRNLVEIPERGYHYFRHYFIPHEGNNHHPLVLRPRALKTYSALLIAVKVFLTGFLYVAYPTQAQFAELTASKIFELTNASRVESGLNTLTLNTTLNRAAQAKANDMLRLGYFEHTGPDGKKFWQWIKEAGYSYSTAGENLAMDFTTAESAHRALMASTSHRNNILKSSYRDVGFAVVEGTMNGQTTTLLVEYFGIPTTTKTVAVQPKQPSTATTAPTAVSENASAYKAKMVGVSDERFILLPNSEISVWVDFQNTGTTTWQKSRGHFVALNVTNPIGRTSAFAHSSWLASYRPALLTQTSVRPGQTGRFTFTLHAPATPLKTTESFALVAENLTWIEGGTVKLPITVTTPRPAVAAAETTAPVTPQEALDAAFNTTTVQVVAPASGDTEGVTEPTPVESSFPLVVPAPTLQTDWKSVTTNWVIRFFWAFFVFLALSLAMTILIRIRIQHRHVILHTMLVLAITSFMIFVPLHYAERIAQVLVQ